MQGAETIEKKLFILTKNANVATTEKRKDLSGPEENFRRHVDTLVDSMSHLSTLHLRRKINQN